MKSYILLFCLLITIPSLFAQVQDTVDIPIQIKQGGVQNQNLPLDSIAPTPPVINQTDTNSTQTDTLSTQKDSLSFRISRDTLDAPIEYTATDSIIYDITNQVVYLYGNASVKYKNINLDAAYIEFSWERSVLIAEGTTGADGRQTGTPVFKEGEQEYRARRIVYNLKTQRGTIHEVITQEGEGYIHGERVKKTEENHWFVEDAHYTTCNLDDPHFYIRAKRMKLIPDKVVVSGPANLVIEDVPTPLYVPFGIFPVKQGQTSGILMPEYGESQAQGFFLKDGGYYFAFSEYIDLQLRGSIYSEGDWGAKAISSYAKRYRFTGGYNFSYGRRKQGIRESPETGGINDFSVSWRHQQDPRTNPTGVFSADVNVATATYDRNFSYEVERVLKNQLNSNISYSRNFPGKPFSLTTSMRHNQSLQTGIVTLTAPEVAFNVSRIQPFRPEVPRPKKRIYDDLSFSYTLNARNYISGIDSTIFTLETLENARYGLIHQPRIQTSTRILNHFTLTPSFDYNERWYFKTIEQSWNPDTINHGDTAFIFGQVETDTIFGFKAARDFTTNLGVSTTIYGMKNFRSKWLKAVRHVITPTLNFRYTPDFGAPNWGYYKEVQTSAEGATSKYSIFSINQDLFGVPPQGRVGGVGLQLNNNIEMKVFAKKDTVTGEKKIRLLEFFNISTFYNIAADSLRLQPLSITAATTLFERIRLSYNSSYSFYATDTANRPINKFFWSERNRPLRLTNTNFSMSSSFQSIRNQPLVTTEGTEMEQEMVMRRYGDFYDFEIPWNFTVGYNLNITRGTALNPDTVTYVQTTDFTVDLNLTPNWKVMVNSGFDIQAKEITYTNINIIRNLHCWELKVRWVPYPAEFQSYSIDLNAKSHILQDLKLSKKRNRFDNPF